MSLLEHDRSAPLVARSIPGIEHLSAQSRRDFVRFGFGRATSRSVLTLGEALRSSISRHGSSTVLVDAAGQSLSYAELDSVSDTLAHQLAQSGVVAGDRVGIFLSRGLELVVGMVAVLKLGATWVPQDARLATTRMLTHIAQIAHIDQILTNAECAERLAEMGLAAREIEIEKLRAVGSAAPGAWRGSVGVSDVAVVIFTSGTTGVPSGVEITHGNVLNTVLEGPASLGIEPGMKVAQLLNIAFDMSIWEIFGALLHGGTLLLRGPDIEATARQANVLIATPSVLAKIDPELCPQAQIVAVAGERCPQALADEWRHRTAFHNSCGPTEVTIVNTVHRLEAGETLTIGAPIPNTTVYVLDDDLRPVEIGEVGEMWAGGACVTRGYLADPALTEERYKPDPFNGGTMFRCRDLVSWTPQGRLLHHGRTDDQVKVHGFRVELDAVTRAMEEASTVRSATTLLVDGELVGVLESTDDIALGQYLPEDPHVREVTAAVATALPHYYAPERYQIVSAIPITARGKVDKRALATDLDDRSNPAFPANLVPPSNPERSDVR